MEALVHFDPGSGLFIRGQHLVFENVQSWGFSLIDREMLPKPSPNLKTVPGVHEFKVEEAVAWLGFGDRKGFSSPCASEKKYLSPSVGPFYPFLGEGSPTKAKDLWSKKSSSGSPLYLRT